MKGKIVFLCSAVSLLVFCFGPVAYPQEKPYPTMPVQIVVPFAAGGGIDLFHRVLAEQLKNVWKVQVNVINKPGAGGAMSAGEVANASKDGYTVLGTLTSNLAAVAVAKPKGINLTGSDDFDPFGTFFAYSPGYICVRSDSPFKTLEDLVQHARNKPGSVVFGLHPVGTVGYLQIQLLKQVAKITIGEVPFAGSGELAPNLLGGNVDAVILTDTVLKPYVQSGKMRAIVADYKSSLFPDIPTFADKGYSQIDLIGSIGLLGPKGLPASVIKSWDTALKMIREKPELLAPFQKVGFNVDLITGTDALRKFYKDEVQKYSRFTPEQLGWKQ